MFELVKDVFKINGIDYIPRLFQLFVHRIYLQMHGIGPVWFLPIATLQA